MIFVRPSLSSNGERRGAYRPDSPPSPHPLLSTQQGWERKWEFSSSSTITKTPFPHTKAREFISSLCFPPTKYVAENSLLEELFGDFYIHQGKVGTRLKCLLLIIFHIQRTLACQLCNRVIMIVSMALEMKACSVLVQFRKRG